MEVHDSGVTSARTLRAVAGGLIAGCLACGGGDPESGPDTAESRLVQVQEAYYRGQYDSAATGFEWIRATAEASEDVATMAVATLWLGLAANRRAQWDSAEVYGERALALALEHDLSDVVPRSYNALGLFAWEDFRPVDAESLFVKSITTAEAARMEYVSAVARGNLALALQDQGDYEGARRGYETLLEVSVRLDSIRTAAAARTNLAALSIREGDARTAALEVPPAISVFRDFGDTFRLQNAFAQLGEAYADLGEPRLAFAAFDTAVAVARTVGDLEVARNLNALASLHQNTGNLTRALNIYEEARAIHDSLGQVTEAAWNLRNSAAIYARLGDVERAREDAQRAAAIHADAGLPVEQIDDAILLAEIARLRDDRAASAGYLARAGELVAELDRPALSVRLDIVRAAFDLEDGRPGSAVSRLVGAEPSFGAVPAGIRAEGLALLARAWAREGDFERAADAGFTAVQALERIRSRFGSSELRSTFLNDRLDAYGDLAAVLFRLGRVEQGFAVVDAARGRGVTANLAAAQGRTPPIAAISSREQMLRRIDALAAQLDTLTDEPAMESVRGELERARRAYDDVYRDAREQLGVDAPLLGIGDADLAAVQGALLPHEALVEFLVSEDRVWSVVVTRDGIYPMSSSVDVSELSQRVRIARDLVASPDNDVAVIGPVTSALHELLIGQARRSGLLADARLLTIVPHTVLDYLPFAALIDPATERFLIEDFDLRYLPSAAALPALGARGSATGRGRTTLFAPKDAELPQTLTEIERIGEVVGRSRRYAGDRGTERRVRAALERPGTVHLATHGVMNAQNPMFSRVELAPGRGDASDDDGRLEVHEVLDLDIKSELVFLSGCETGVGAAWATVQGRGEDHTTLERAFLYAGAGNVVSTLWPIDDRGASILGASFYGSAAAGAAPATRLAGAQRAMLDDPAWAAPYYWAGYRLSGSNRPGSPP